MNEPKKFHLPERNPITHAAHRREVFWQITLPLMAIVILLLAIIGTIIWVSVTPVRQSFVSRWADISTIWLLLPVLVFSLLVLVFLAALVYGFYRLIRVIPGVTRLIHNYIILFQTKVGQIADLAVEPFLKVRSAAAGLKAFRRNLSK